MTSRYISYPNVCGGDTLNFNYWSDTGFYRLVDEIFAQEQYGEPFMDIHYDTVLDVGANIGMFSMWISDRAGIIHAIEPYTKNYECLDANIKKNELSIIPHKVAITGDGRDVEMFTPVDPLGTKIRKNEKDVEVEKVKSTTLLKFLDDNDIETVSLMKIDIEGTEFDIFTPEAMKLLAPRIKNMIGEHTSNNMTSALKPYYELGNIEGKRIWYAKRK